MFNKRKNQEFFKEQIKPHHHDLIKFLRHATGDEWLAQDITQSTMEDAWKYIDRMRSYDNVKGALISIAKNNLKKQYNKNPIVVVPLEEMEEIVSADISLEDILIKTESDHDLRKLIHELEEKYERIIILRYFYDLTLKEIADMLSQNYNTVLSWHSRAIKKLREMCMKNEKIRLNVIGGDEK